MRATHMPSNLRIPLREDVNYLRDLRAKRISSAKRRDRKSFDAFIQRQIEVATTA